MQHISDHHNRCTSQSSDGIKVSAQYNRNFRDENVARHAPANSCQHAEQRRRDWAKVIGKSLRRARNGEKRQTRCIE